MPADGAPAGVYCKLLNNGFIKLVRFVPYCPLFSVQCFVLLLVGRSFVRVLCNFGFVMTVHYRKNNKIGI